MPILKPLPKIMIAPNGARKTKADHSQLPITIPEIISTARECWQAGANGIHIHVRDEQGAHTLDPGLYKEALAELERHVPKLQRQITTESVGLYSPEQQREVVKNIQPDSASISIAEMLADKENKKVGEFYKWCSDADIAVQHIIYNLEDLRVWSTFFETDKNVNEQHQMLFVLGRYSNNLESSTEDLAPFVKWVESTSFQLDWAVCAFGRAETDCLLAAHKAGGKMRIGFENSLWNKDGSMALNNAQRVEELSRMLIE